MKRRQFMALAAATLAAGAAGAYAPFADNRRSATGAGLSQPMDVAQFRALRRYASTRFGDIAYVERGAGPAALFLHAHPLNGFQWRGALDRLASHRRCIAPDFLGLGYTRVASGQSVAPAAQAAMLVALLDKLAIAAVDLSLAIRSTAGTASLSISATSISACAAGATPCAPATRV